jgi:gluconate kinase
MSFTHTLKKKERDILRRVVKKVHLAYWPKDFCTDTEADKVINAIAPEVAERMIKFGVDNYGKL